MKIQISEHFTVRKLLQFTLPTIIMMIFTSVYGVVDGLFISNFVGSESFAAVNLIMPAIMILGSIGFMIGTGGSAIVSMTLGLGKQQKASEYFSMLIKLLIYAGIILTVIGIALMKPIAIMLGAEGNMVHDCVVYGSILMAAITAFLLQNSFQSFLVVAEKPKFGLVISLLAGITNMVLDFVFIYIFHMGVAGAALATAISQVVGGIIPLIYFLRKKEGLRIVKSKFDWNVIAKTSANGSSEMVTNISMSLVNMLYNLQLLKYAGANGVVAYGIIMYISFIFSGTYMGYSVGTAPVISYHYGAGNKKELKSLFCKSMGILLVFAVIMTLCAEVLSKPLSAVFVGYDKELLEMTITAVRIYSVSYLLSEINIFASSFFTALNNGFISAAISFLRTFLFQIAMIYILPVFMGLSGIWFAIIVAEVLSLAVSIAFIILNRKKYGYL